MARDHEDEMNAARQARTVKAFHCQNPACRRTHVALYDEKGIFAHFVMPEGFLKTLQDFEYLSAVERTVR